MSEVEHTLYKKVVARGQLLIVCIYVDDLICMGSSKGMIKEFKQSVKKAFEMSNLGLMPYFLGLVVKQDQGCIHICQRKYVEDLLKSYHLQQCKPVPTPLSSDYKLVSSNDELVEDITSYRRLVGKLMYVTHTSLDIVFPVSFLRRFMYKPTSVMFGSAKHILKYLARTVNYRILFKRNANRSFLGFSDSDQGGSIEDRESTYGVVFLYGTGAVTQMSKKQEILVLSTAKPEYVALCSAWCQGVWVKRLLNDCGMKHEEATPIYCDNMSCIAIVKKIQ